jgi:hypothetical protein
MVAPTFSNGNESRLDRPRRGTIVPISELLHTDSDRLFARLTEDMERRMNNIIWLVGAIVIVLFILGALGLR